MTEEMIDQQNYGGEKEHKKHFNTILSEICAQRYIIAYYIASTYQIKQLNAKILRPLLSTTQERLGGQQDCAIQSSGRSSHDTKCYLSSAPNSTWFEKYYWIHLSFLCGLLRHVTGVLSMLVWRRDNRALPAIICKSLIID